MKVLSAVQMQAVSAGAIDRLAAVEAGLEAVVAVALMTAAYKMDDKATVALAIAGLATLTVSAIDAVAVYQAR